MQITGVLFYAYAYRNPRGSKKKIQEEGEGGGGN
jgi:hypothetical protein